MHNWVAKVGLGLNLELNALVSCGGGCAVAFSGQNTVSGRKLRMWANGEQIFKEQGKKQRQRIGQGSCAAGANRILHLVVGQCKATHDGTRGVGTSPPKLTPGLGICETYSHKHG